MLAGIVDATATLGERRAQAHYLDSLAMVDLVEGDPRGAQRRLAEAARIAAGIDTPSLTASVAVHRALALLAAGDLAAAAREASACAEQVANPGARAHASVAIEHAALTACLALATGDRKIAAAAASEMARRAAQAADTRYTQAAARITAAITASTTAPPPSPATLPRLIWLTTPH